MAARATTPTSRLSVPILPTPQSSSAAAAKRIPVLPGEHAWRSLLVSAVNVFLVSVDPSVEVEYAVLR